MAAKTKTQTTSKFTGKKRVSKAQLNKGPAGAPASEQDPKRRLGNYTGAGEHARQGSRTAGIVGQTKRKNHTDKRS